MLIWLLLLLWFQTNKAVGSLSRACTMAHGTTESMCRLMLLLLLLLFNVEFTVLTAIGMVSGAIDIRHAGTKFGRGAFFKRCDFLWLSFIFYGTWDYVAFHTKKYSALFYTLVLHT